MFYSEILATKRILASGPGSLVAKNQAEAPWSRVSQAKLWQGNIYLPVCVIKLALNLKTCFVTFQPRIWCENPRFIQLPCIVARQEVHTVTVTGVSLMQPQSSMQPSQPPAARALPCCWSSFPVDSHPAGWGVLQYRSATAGLGQRQVGPPPSPLSTPILWQLGQYLTPFSAPVRGHAMLGQGPPNPI